MSDIAPTGYNSRQPAVKDPTHHQSAETGGVYNITTSRHIDDDRSSQTRAPRVLGGYYGSNSVRRVWAIEGGRSLAYYLLRISMRTDG